MMHHSKVNSARDLLLVMLHVLHNQSVDAEVTSDNGAAFGARKRVKGGQFTQSLIDQSRAGEM